MARFDVREAAQSPPIDLTWCAYTNERVLDLFGERFPFKYTEYFPSESDLIQYTILEREEILRRSDFFDAQFAGTDLGKAHENFIAFAFHAFRLNTWWTQWTEGRDWFSVWEGNCYYHSTLDVEYNDALVYLALWPELLERLLEQWTRFEVSGTECLGEARGAETAFLAHDMGSGGRVGEPHYHHAMPVEEACNWLLLAHAHWRWTGRDAIVARHGDLVRRLARFLVQADTTGNGAPDTGVANTLDDATAAVQFGREQVYLGFKTYAALEMTAEIARYLRDGRTVTALRQQAAKVFRTLEERGWLVDHYAVALSDQIDGAEDAWTGRPLEGKALAGWDAYSIYTANGLLYPWLVGVPVRANRNRIRRDILNAMAQTLGEYGCSHTSACRDRVWISQNLWRDYVAAYFDLDCFRHICRYWDYQVLAGRNRPVTCYFDTVGNNLAFYPRGITAIGAFFAACRFQLDRVGRRCQIAPAAECRDLPLLALARWDKQQVPRLSCTLDGGRPRVKISHRHCLRGLRLMVKET